MNNVLSSLTEDQLRKLVGDAAVDRAARHLLTGKVQERVRWPEGGIDAYWDTRLDDISIHAESRKQGIAFGCTCGELEGDNICDHVLALLLAWVTDPASFVPGQDDFDQDEEDYDFDNEVEEPVYSFPRTVKAAGPVEPPDKEYLRLLSSLTVHELREIARTRGVPVSGNRKEPVLEAVAEALSSNDSIDQVWLGLSPAARLVAGLLPFFLSSKNYLGRNAVWKTAQKWGLHSEIDFQHALEDLKLAGLAFLSSSGTLSFPSILPLALPADPEFTPAYDLPAAGIRTERAVSAQDFIQKLAGLLLVLQAGENRFKAKDKPALHPVLQKAQFLQGWPYDPQELSALEKEKNFGSTLWTRTFRLAAAPSPLEDETRQALANLLHTGVERVDFCVRLLVACGLVLMKEGQPLKVDMEKAHAWLRLSPYERAHEMLPAYTNLDNWTEFDLVFEGQRSFAFRRSPRFDSPVGYKQMLVLLADARRTLLYQVRRQPAGRWTDFGTFVERARLLPDVPLAFSGGVPWYFELNGRKLDLGKLEDWKAFYRLYAGAVLAGPLHWQGLVELAYQQKDLVAFCLTDFGAALLNQNIPYQFPSAESVVPALEYGADGSLLLHSEAAGGDLLKLLSLLGEARLGSNSAIAYRVSAEGASRAFSAGWSLDQVTALLQDSTGSPLPEDLSAALQRWWQGYGSLHFYEDIALLEFADDFILNELMAGTSLPLYLLYRFSQRLIAIRQEGVDILREELVKKGYTPKFAS